MLPSGNPEVGELTSDKSAKVDLSSM